MVEKGGGRCVGVGFPLWLPLFCSFSTFQHASGGWCGDGRMPIRLLRLTLCFNRLHAWFVTDFSAFSALILQLHRAQPFTFRNWYQELGGASFVHASLIFSDERSKMSQNPLPSVLILDSADCCLVTVILTLTMLSELVFCQICLKLWTSASRSLSPWELCSLRLVASLWFQHHALGVSLPAVEISQNLKTFSPFD